MLIVSLINQVSQAYMRFSSVLQNIFTVLLLWFLITSNEGTQSMKLRCVCDTHTMSELEASLLKKNSYFRICKEYN